MLRHLKNLADGTDGPWVLHTRKMSSFTEVRIGDEVMFILTETV